MKTILKEGKVKPFNPTIIEGLPGLGSVGKIAASYLISQLKAKKIEELYSPHF
ncbi:TPA: proteasome assembly chaperone family protein, partial [Candidatus Bathyarchaeota archaeon]|nr:proteasome assembly chaperone family protein [Candidatus Bathyarchaeota archaeon]